VARSVRSRERLLDRLVVALGVLLLAAVRVVGQGAAERGLGLGERDAVLRPLRPGQ
jgi:hypothetical protein